MVVLGSPQEAIVTDTMGSFRADVELEHPGRAGYRRVLRAVVVDAATMLSWFPRDVIEELGAERIEVWRFRRPDGAVFERWTAAVVIRAGGRSAIDEVVIGEPGDAVVLGAHSLSGLNLRVDWETMRLVDAGPILAAVAA
jgi:hypothetical protein